MNPSEQHQAARTLKIKQDIISDCWQDAAFMQGILEELVEDEKLNSASSRLSTLLQTVQKIKGTLAAGIR